MNVVHKVRQFTIAERLIERGETVVVGVSGGPDSLCLLHVLCRLRDELSLTIHVAHLNHLIRGKEAVADARFVARLAEEWELPCTVEERDVPRLARESRLAIEEAARQARYAFLAQVALKLGARKIAVAHNADDQAETVLMHWLRGAGLAGLRGMLPATPMNELRLEAAWPDHPPLDLLLIRPLLEVPRVEIEAYCRQHGLEPRFDRSNLDTTYFRNKLRHELLPYLEREFKPRFREILRRSARVIRDDYALLRDILMETWPRVVASESERAVVFALETWRELHPSLQRSTLREAVHRLRRSLRNINFVHVEDAVQVARRGPTGAQATLPQGLMLTVGYETLTVGDGDYVPLPDWPALMEDVGLLPLRVPGETPLPDSPWQLEARLLDRRELPPHWEDNPDPWQAFLDFQRVGDELFLRRRRVGDRFQPLGMGGRGKLVSHFMTNAKIPRPWRDLVPLVVNRQHVVWVCGWRLDERARVREDTQRVLHLRFRRIYRHSENVFG